ncbi:terminase small subunit [Dysgonomonas sp. GY617]|uniref:terminase small subunit n=1 Tax=Dysgonomonas sp. GY617 TaxID=2780420 RepID=UPI0018841FD4|nr:terminase small subunit [Dysgonomonas sp. GY617]MBF0577965.1 DNA packaging protein [Dysgonomonas sp. GY617]
MAAPKGNQFWKLRTKHNRKALFESPELLLKAADEYFEWCDKHQWYKQEAVKSGSECGRIIDVPIKRPYSISGLCVYLNCSQSFFNKFKKKCGSDFTEIINRIENIIETQQFEGAITGIFNTSIISRKLGLKEQTDITSNGQSIFQIEVIDDKTKEQLERLKEKLK